jgi:hypothetical protein
MGVRLAPPYGRLRRGQHLSGAAQRKIERMEEELKKQFGLGYRSDLANYIFAKCVQAIENELEQARQHEREDEERRDVEMVYYQRIRRTAFMDAEQAIRRLAR